MKQINAQMVRWALIALAILAQPSMLLAKTQLLNINSAALSKTQQELSFTFSEAPPLIKAYQLETPLRLVLDFEGTSASIAQRFYDFGDAAVVQAYSVIDNTERTRVTLDLSQKGAYSTRVDGNTLYLKVANLGVATAPVPASDTKPASVERTLSQAVPGTTQSVAASQPTQQSTGPEITDIDFKRGVADSGADILVNLGNAKIPVDVTQQGTKIVVKFLGAKVPERLRKRLDVTDFATAVSTIDAYNDTGTAANGMLVIQTNGIVDFSSYQTDDRLTISVFRPKKDTTTAVRQEQKYSGQKLSLNFQDIEVRAVLQLIADFTNLNIVASDSVKSNITIRLQNVPWDQALDIILRTKGLAKRINGNVVLIAPAEELSALEQKEVQALQQEEQLAPLRTEYIQLSYAKAIDIVALISDRAGGSGSGNITTAQTSGGGSSNSAQQNKGLLSNRGVVSIDARTNTIIVVDTADRIEEIRNMIARIDVPVRQVMIEARIVRATDNFSKELGVKWGLLSQGITSNKSLLVGGSDTTLFNLREPDINTTTGEVTYTIDRPDNLNVDLGVTSTGASRLALGLLSLSDVMIDLELSALQADGKGEVIATPKVLTADKQKARVASGTQIPYETSAASGATTIAFVNAELSLEVTPNITADGRIGMELLVNNDTPGNVLANGAVAINTNRVTTNVLVDDGQTVVLGGIFQNTIGNNVTKVPFLGDLPIIGRLFKKTVQINNKQELLIFVTPRLVNDNESHRTGQ